MAARRISPVTQAPGAAKLTIKVDPSTVNFNSTQNLAALNIATGSTAKLVENGAAGYPPYVAGNKYLGTKALTIAGTGKLDIGNNAVVIDYSGGPSPLAAITALIASGANIQSGTPHWDGAVLLPALRTATSWPIRAVR